MHSHLHSLRSPVNFHAADGSGYAFMGDSVLQVDKINHQVGAIMVWVLHGWDSGVIWIWIVVRAEMVP